MKKNECCKNCRFSREFEAYAISGITCNYDNPKCGTVVEGSTVADAVWPLVYEDRWCGKWEPRG